MNTKFHGNRRIKESSIGVLLLDETIIDETGKFLTSLLPESFVTGLNYKGAYNASSGVYPSNPATGDYYIVSVGGTISGKRYDAGDWMIYNGTSWEKIDNTDTIASVNGKTGVVILTTNDIAEGASNLYFTNDRAKLAVVLNAPAWTEEDKSPSAKAVKDKIQASLPVYAGFVKMNGTVDGSNLTFTISGSYNSDMSVVSVGGIVLPKNSYTITYSSGTNTSTVVLGIDVLPPSVGEEVMIYGGAIPTA